MPAEQTCSAGIFVKMPLTIPTYSSCGGWWTGQLHILSVAAVAVGAGAAPPEKPPLQKWNVTAFSDPGSKSPEMQKAPSRNSALSQ